MCVSAPKMEAPPPPPPAPKPAKKANESVRRARSQSQKRSRAAGGDASTQLTGPRGLMAPANTANATLLSGN
jgi:hypothetical protein